MASPAAARTARVDGAAALHGAQTKGAVAIQEVDEEHDPDLPRQLPEALGAAVQEASAVNRLSGASDPDADLLRRASEQRLAQQRGRLGRALKVGG